MIGRGTHVEITAGEYAGCFGVVRDVWLDDTNQPQLSVEFWSGSAGRFVWSLFNASQLRLHALPPISREFFELAVIGQELRAA